MLKQEPTEDTQQTMAAAATPQPAPSRALSVRSITPRSETHMPSSNDDTIPDNDVVMNGMNTDVNGVHTNELTNGTSHFVLSE